MVRAFLALGSNLGDRRAHLVAAVGAIEELVAVSPVYETEPVGGPEQGRFYNIVVELRTSRTPHELLGLCQELELQAERVRQVRWGPRTLDVDVLLFGNEVVADEDLSVPHPRMLERNFVMVPLLVLAPDLIPTVEAMGYDRSATHGEVTWVGPL